MREELLTRIHAAAVSVETIWGKMGDKADKQRLHMDAYRSAAEWASTLKWSALPFIADFHVRPPSERWGFGLVVKWLIDRFAMRRRARLPVDDVSAEGLAAMVGELRTDHPCCWDTYEGDREWHANLGWDHLPLLCEVLFRHRDYPDVQNQALDAVCHFLEWNPRRFLRALMPEPADLRGFRPLSRDEVVDRLAGMCYGLGFGDSLELRERGEEEWAASLEWGELPFLLEILAEPPERLRETAFDPAVPIRDALEYFAGLDPCRYVEAIAPYLDSPRGRPAMIGSLYVSQEPATLLFVLEFSRRTDLLDDDYAETADSLVAMGGEQRPALMEDLRRRLPEGMPHALAQITRYLSQGLDRDPTAPSGTA